MNPQPVANTTLVTANVTDVLPASRLSRVGTRSMVVRQRETANLRLRPWFGFEVPKIDARVEQGAYAAWYGNG
jgi:hypothetical protein